MIYLKSTSQLHNSYKGITLYFQLSLTATYSNWLQGEFRPLQKQQSRGRGATRLGGSVAPHRPSPRFSPSFSLPCLNSASVLKDTGRHHVQWRQRSTKTLLHPAGFIPGTFKETVSRNHLSDISFICIELGPVTILNQLLAMRNGLSLLVETSQDFSPIPQGGMDPQTPPANSKEWVTRVTQQCLPQTHRKSSSFRKE